MTGHWGIVVEGNYPLSKWEIVHNDQAVSIPGEFADLLKVEGVSSVLKVICDSQEKRKVGL